MLTQTDELQLHWKLWRRRENRVILCNCGQTLSRPVMCWELKCFRVWLFLESNFFIPLTHYARTFHNPCCLFQRLFYWYWNADTVLTLLQSAWTLYFMVLFLQAIMTMERSLSDQIKDRHCLNVWFWFCNLGWEWIMIKIHPVFFFFKSLF